MKQYPDVKLHVKYTDLSFWAGLIFMPPVFAILFFILMGGDNSTLKTIIFGLIFLTIFVLFLWVEFTMCKAEIKDNQLYLKKYFRPTKVFKLSELKDVKTMSFTNAKHIQISSDGVRARRDTYNWVTLEKDGVKEKFMIIGYNFFLGDEPVDSEQILKEIAAENKK